MNPNVSESVIETCDRYGEQVIGIMLAGGFNPSTNDLQTINASAISRQDARDWLTERNSLQEYRERWVPLRDFILEIVVVGLIGWEIVLGIRQEKHQGENFDQQQKVLTSMQESSESTAKTLTALQNTTETMNKSVERNAAAAEATSTTAAKSLVLSERAYVSCVTTGDEPKEGEKLRARSSILNSGKTPAIDFEAKSMTGLVPKNTSIEEARKLAVSVAFDEKAKSKSILGPGQSSQQGVESNAALSTGELSALRDFTEIWYVFSFVRYKDTFNHQHTTETCNRYEPDHKIMVLCSEGNKAD
ncbi:MAG TPA: hypothetical protein VN943_12570 [Candidatus Acidoferrum sp.]|nr:hypothetical protein [Candidatus Acidoferrum sp.]